MNHIIMTPEAEAGVRRAVQYIMAGHAADPSFVPIVLRWQHLLAGGDPIVWAEAVLPVVNDEKAAIARDEALRWETRR